MLVDSLPGEGDGGGGLFGRFVVFIGFGEKYGKKKK